MKAALIFLAIFSSVTAWAQLPSRNTSLTLDAKAVSSGGSTLVKQGAAGSVRVPGSGASAATAASTQTHQSVTRVEVQMRNLGTVPAQARLEWYFVARPMREGYRLHDTVSEYVWDSGKLDVSVAPGGEQKETLGSVPLTETLAKKSTASTTDYQTGQTVTSLGDASATSSGARPVGWIVRLMDGDQLLRVQASSNDLEAIGRDTAQLTRMVQSKPKPVVPMGVPGRPVLQPPR